MQTSRRNLIAAGAVVIAAPAFTAAKCSSESGTGLDPAVQDAINKAITKACGIIPLAAVLVQILAQYFPAALGAVTITESLLGGIVGKVCDLFTSQAAARAAGKPMAANETVVHGWHIENGKLVEF